MNLLLVFPSSRVAGWGSSRPGGNLDGCFMPQGIAMIGSVLRRAGHRVTTLDFRACSHWDTVRGMLNQQRWNAILLGWLSAETPNAEEFIRLANQDHPGVPIIAGGIHVTVSHLMEMPGVTSILHGEGDDEVLNILESREPVVLCKPIQDLDALPFVDRTLFSPYESTCHFLPLLDPPFASVLFGRGCPYGTYNHLKKEGCTYCYRSAMSAEFNAHRTRSPESCVAEIHQLHQQFNGLGSYMVHDDLFPLHHRWVEQFIAEYHRTFHSTRIPFWCQMRADQVIRFKELIPDLARIGLTWVSLGMESIHPETLRFIGKGVTVEQNWEAIDILHANQINLFLNYIRHLPGETEESVKATTDALKIIRPSFHAASTYTDMPGTVMNQYCRDHDLVTDEHYSLTRYPYEPKLKGIDYDGPIHQMWEAVLQYKRDPMRWTG